MPASLDRLDQLIVESEERITEQILRIMAAEAKGLSTKRLRRSLKAFEGILVEYYRARKLVAEAKALVDRPEAPGGETSAPKI